MPNRRTDPLPVTDGTHGNARQWWILGAIALVGLTLTVVFASSVLNTVRQTKLAEVQSRVADLVGRIETEFNVQMATLRATRAFVAVNDNVKPETFSAFAASLDTGDVGTVAYGWAERISGEGGGVGYRVDMLHPDGPARTLDGVDLAELASLNDALQKSIDFNEIHVSEVLSTETTGGHRNFVVAMLPVYAANAQDFLVEQRRQNARGILFSVLDPATTVGFVIASSSFAQMIDDGVLGVEIVTHDGGNGHTPLYRSRDYERLSRLTEDSGLYSDTAFSSRELMIAQRRVHIHFAIDPTGLGTGPLISAASVFAIGLILTLAFLVYVWSRINYDRRVAALVRERTRALEASEQRMLDMADVSADWFWEMDSDFRFTYLSERFEQMTGIPRSIFLGRTRLEAAGIANLRIEENWRDHMNDLENRRAFSNFRYTISKGGGREEHVSISGKPVFDEDGAFIGYRGSGRDVTFEETANRRMRESEARMQRNVRQLEESRQELEESTARMAELAERYAIEKDRAEASERSKSEFLASMSHEIRTPMTGVMGFADMLLDSSLRPEDREKVIKIKGATQSLLTIINDILDLSKLDAGRLSIEHLDFNIKTAVDEVLDLVRERARVKNLSLTADFSDGIEVGMHGDPTRFRQILINLVGNAVKFTHKGGVTIKVRQSGDGNDEFIEFRVIDTGIGISPENQKRLFSDFSQADASISRHYEGTGLGLAISKRLVELMGGEIWVESEAGKGSQFCFRLPFEKAKSDVTGLARHHVREHFRTTRPLNILVAEDNRLNQRIIVATLDKFGHNATVVENGEQAVEWVGQGEYDLILMDVRMPEMSGPDATRAIRARHDHIAAIPIIALTADAMEEHIRSYLDAGMNACVTKPIDRATLVLAINDVLGEEIHVPIGEAEVARDGYAVPTDDELEQAAEAQSGVISVSDFLNQLDDVAEEIEREKRAKK